MKKDREVVGKVFHLDKGLHRMKKKMLLPCG